MIKTRKSGVFFALKIKLTLIMERNFTNSNPLEKLNDILNLYYSQSKKKMSYEYIMFNDHNGNLLDSKNLVNLTHRFPVKVNIIEYKYVDGVPYSKTTEERICTFVKYLVDNGVIATVRRSRGKDIDAACCQLANKVK